MTLYSAKRGLVLSISLGVAVGAATFDGPFRLFEPAVTVDESLHQRLKTGDTFVTVLPGRDGHLSVSAVVRVDAPADRLASWARHVELQKGRYVAAIGRFSSPPQERDLEGLMFEEADLEDLAACRPGDCNVKLSASEMSNLQRIEGPDRQARLQTALRQLLVARATAYVHGGDASLEPYADDDDPVAPGEVFESLLRRLEFLPRHFPRLAEFVRRFPAAVDPLVTDSFVYWSKETLGVKPIIGITHVTIARFESANHPEVVIVAKQVFATHYKNGSITVTAMTGNGSERFVIYVQRAHVDVLQGMLGGMARRLLERRVRDEAPGVLLGLRERLEQPIVDPR